MPARHTCTVNPGSDIRPIPRHGGPRHRPVNDERPVVRRHHPKRTFVHVDRITRTSFDWSASLPSALRWRGMKIRFRRLDGREYELPAMRRSVPGRQGMGALRWTHSCRAIPITAARYAAPDTLRASMKWKTILGQCFSPVSQVAGGFQSLTQLVQLREPRGTSSTHDVPPGRSSGCRPEVDD